MKYKLLVVDVDGTLIGREGSVPIENKKALAKARDLGVMVSLSTGRVPRACLKIIKQLSLDGYHIFFDGALVSNTSQREEVYIQPLNKLTVRQAIEFARANGIYLELYSATRYFVERETWGTDVHRQFFNLEPIMTDFTELLPREQIIKAELMTSTPEEVAQANSFHAEFKDRLHFSWVKTPAYPDVDFINVVDPGVSKGKALEALVSHLGISLTEVMAVGDGTNDIPLLSSVGLAVAMGNASDKVKAIAHYLTLDVDHSGLAVAINEFLL